MKDVRLNLRIGGPSVKLLLPVRCSANDMSFACEKFVRGRFLQLTFSLLDGGTTHIGLPRGGQVPGGSES